ncbi:hypothetical protein [Kitasatospora griseola]|uniref:hypothetical protein n=1 Tax=Kitasatospora griseola TaxID=2064 RepID=UPI00381E0097
MTRGERSPHHDRTAFLVLDLLLALALVALEGATALGWLLWGTRHNCRGTTPRRRSSPSGTAAQLTAVTVVFAGTGLGLLRLRLHFAAAVQGSWAVLAAVVLAAGLVELLRRRRSGTGYLRRRRRPVAASFRRLTKITTRR